jgi:hypothetical protein
MYSSLFHARSLDYKQDKLYEQFPHPSWAKKLSGEAVQKEYWDNANRASRKKSKYRHKHLR